MKLTDTNAHFDEMTEKFEDILNRYSSDIPLPNEGDIFDIHFGDHAERYAYMGSDKCVPLYPLEGKFVSYTLNPTEVEFHTWDDLMEALDEAFEQDEVVWVETVLRRNSEIGLLEEKINTLKARLLTVRDPQSRVNIKNQIEFLEA